MTTQQKDDVIVIREIPLLNPDVLRLLNEVRLDDVAVQIQMKLDTIRIPVLFADIVHLAKMAR